MSSKPGPAKIMSLRSGTDWSVEEQADEWLAENRAEGRGDILSHDQLALRQSREIPNHLGVADASLVVGMYRRVFNPLAGSRPGKQRHSHDD